MPELPEVETVRRVLEPLLRGRTVEGVELRWERTLELPLDLFRARVVGRKIEGVGRRGKLLLMQLDDGGTVTVHLRMTGELLFREDAGAERDARREPYLRALLSLSGGAELLFYDVRKFGRIGLLPAEGGTTLERRLGIEPLDEAFTPEALAALLRGRARRMKPLLLDQQVIAGLGNIYVDESLFRARIHPLLPARDVPDERVAALHRAIVDVLRTAVELQGTTLRDYRTGTGASGGNQTRLLVYGQRPGTPCPECGTPLERLVITQRGSIFCPNCQPLPAVTPDRPGR